MSTKLPLKHTPVRGTVEETIFVQSKTDQNIKWKVTRSGNNWFCACPARIAKCNHIKIAIWNQEK